ncbi:CAF17-like 4Fe-4S cluster assembly/insertion protein YgfZ [Arhodomonas sp. AD133]|uniref:CAF17-like 4Fe-4S cluster assembly/insertion protein YgfZ n=1 Tax=Arhodomonas sp. AD133 TaxID=3415009 RepID=UPI003EB79B61
MHSTWSEILDGNATPDGGIQLGATPDELERLETAPVVAPLTDTGVIRVTGADAPAFLHAQFTNAIDDMQAPSSRLAGWCNPKGRLLALLRVIRTDDGFLLLLPRTLVASVVKRLRMFVLRSKVTVEDASEAVTVTGIAGASASMLLAEVIGTPPGAGDEVSTAGDLIAVRLADMTPRWLLIAPASQTPDLWRTLSGGLAAVGTAIWRLLDIRAGLPEVVTETRERFVPQMVNLEPLGGLSYEKGCYPGQEVVARMHYLGQLKRRLYRLHGAGDPPAAGTRVSAGDKEAGELVSSAPCGPDVFEALAVLRIDTADSGTPLTVNDRNLEIAPLPYTPPGEGE